MCKAKLFDIHTGTKWTGRLKEGGGGWGMGNKRDFQKRSGYCPKNAPFRSGPSRKQRTLAIIFENGGKVSSYFPTKVAHRTKNQWNVSNSLPVKWHFAGKFASKLETDWKLSTTHSHPSNRQANPSLDEMVNFSQIRGTRLRFMRYNSLAFVMQVWSAVDNDPERCFLKKNPLQRFLIFSQFDKTIESQF